MKDGIEDIFTDVPLLSLCMLVEGRDIGFEEFNTITAVTSKYPYTNEQTTYYGLNNLTNTGNQDEMDVWIFGSQN